MDDLLSVLVECNINSKKINNNNVKKQKKKKKKKKKKNKTIKPRIIHLF